MYMAVIYVQLDDNTGPVNVFSGGPGLNRKTNDTTQLKSDHFILAQSGTSIKFRSLSFQLLLSSQSDSISAGNYLL